MYNTPAEDGKDEYATFGQTKAWDYHDHAHAQADSEIT
jgi:hypothetical protein